MPGALAQPLAEPLVGVGEGLLIAALHPGEGGLAEGGGGEDHVVNPGFLAVGAGASDADDVLHPILAVELVGIDPDARHPHPRAHHRQGAPAVGAGVAEHPAHRAEEHRVFQVGFGDVLRAQRVAGHQDRFGDHSVFGAVVRGRHGQSLLFDFVSMIPHLPLKSTAAGFWRPKKGKARGEFVKFM